MGLLVDRVAGSLGYIWDTTELGHSGGYAPHDLSAATKHRRNSESGQTAHAIWRTLPHTSLGEMPS